MLASTFLAEAAEVVHENDPKDLYPHLEELIVGAIAFAILFFFMWKWVLPRIGKLLDQRRDKIQGDLERAEELRREAEALLEDHKQRLVGTREEASKMLEEARETAERMRAELLEKAQREAEGIVARAQDEIRAERDRVFQELRGQVAQLAVELAGRVVEQSLDQKAHQQMIDRYIDQVSGDGRN